MDGSPKPPRRVERAGGALLVAVAADAGRARRISRLVTHAGHVVVAEGVDAQALLAACVDRRPHIAVLAWANRVDEGASDVRLLRAATPQTRIVVVSGHHELEVRTAVSAGADGVVREGDVELTLPVVIRSVALGQMSVPRSGRRSLVSQPSALTPREQQVLALLAQGLANAAIADRLCIADSTVKSHVAALFSKLGVSSREDAIAVARSSARPGADAVQAQSVGDPRRRRQII